MTILWQTPFWTGVYGLIAVIFISMLYGYRWYKKHQVAQLLALRYSSRLLPAYNVSRLTIKALFFGGMMLTMWLAWLWPYVASVELPQTKVARDVYIALDISRSMQVQDVQPNRLQKACAGIHALVNALDAERVGLILFSSSAFIQCPLTDDKNAFNYALNMVDEQSAMGGSTMMSSAITTALDSFSRIKKRNTKLLVIFTDGQDYSSSWSPIKSWSSIKLRAQREGMYLIVVGVGSPDGGPIPDYSIDGIRNGFVKDKHDKIVISRREDQEMMKLVNEVGGMYVPLAHGTDDIQRVVSFIRKFDKEFIEERVFLHEYDLYPHFLVMSFICGCIEWLL